MDPHCNSPCPIALLLVAFAFGRPSCSNFGGQSFRRFFRKTKLIKFLGVGDWSLRGSDPNLIKSLESAPGLPEDQLDQILGQDQSSKYRLYESGGILGKVSPADLYMVRRDMQIYGIKKCG